MTIWACMSLEYSISSGKKCEQIAFSWKKSHHWYHLYASSQNPIGSSSQHTPKRLCSQQLYLEIFKLFLKKICKIRKKEISRAIICQTTLFEYENYVQYYFAEMGDTKWFEDENYLHFFLPNREALSHLRPKTMSYIIFAEWAVQNDLLLKPIFHNILPK